MSRNLSAVQAELFDSEVKNAYQGDSKLRMCVRIRNNVEGGVYKFRRKGKGLATERNAPSSDVNPMNVDHALIPATLTDWDASEYTDIYNNKAVNFDEVVELAEVISGALGRRDDQLIIDAMAGGTFSATPAATEGGLVGTDVGGAGTGLNVAKLRAGQKFLNKRGVPMSDRYCAVDAEGLDDLLASTEVTSSDYNAVKALVQGEVNTFLGFKFIMIEDRTEGGLNLTGSLQDAFMWHKDAVGSAVGIDMETRVDYSVDKKSWLSTGSHKAGSALIDNEGVVKLQYTV